MHLALTNLAWQADWNWTLGWSLVIVGFVWGAALGLGFQRADFLGGYQSFPRRLLRLGHVACIALGGFNLLWALAPLDSELIGWGGLGWAVGGVLMPTICALTAWRPAFRHWFFLPVLGVTLGALIGLVS
jgi:hypothetical protein